MFTYENYTVVFSYIIYSHSQSLFNLWKDYEQYYSVMITLVLPVSLAGLPREGNLDHQHQNYTFW